ncbi:lysophospholipid acyltransferase family protein [Cognatiyoonia sp.]|uniref:lysophospholipid acyltransferase family protein n=1 Tax=Cognatiyoonia sp. TaxID=2211652 RepID=UPI003F698BAF
MTQDNPPSGKTLDWLADRALRAMFGGVMKLPYKQRVPAMGAAVTKAIGPLGGYKKRALKNLAMVYPEMEEAERDRIADGVCDNFGRTLIENYSYEDFAHHLQDTQPIGPGLAALEQAVADKQPVIFVTGHFGNHEAPRQVLVRMGYDVGGLYRPMANAYFDDHYAKTMTNWGGPVFPQGRKGTMAFARHIGRGGLGTLLFDVNNDRGHPIPFLGKPALTALSAAEIALKMNAIMIPYFGIRQADGLNFDVEVEEPIAHSNPETMTAEATQRLEAQIKRQPEQWFWIHRRWKNKAGKLSELGSS